MGDSACVMHGFSYVSPLHNNDSTQMQGNPMHALGESVSFGRFMTESLSWEKWSTFSHKKYVEEAERYAQPGSVAQKKAFFEAHYKKIAAQKAAALLEQENAAKAKAEGDVYNNNSGEQKRVVVDSQLDVDAKLEENGSSALAEFDKEEEKSVIIDNEALEKTPMKRNSFGKVQNFENQETVSVSEGSGTPQIERPLLKQSSVASEDVPSVTSKKRTSLSSLKSSIQRRTWRIPATPAKPENVTENTRKSSVDSMDKKGSSPKSLRALISLIPRKDPDKEAISVTRKSTKDCTTPLMTPNVAASKGGAKYPTTTPRSDNRRMKAPIDSSAPRSKTSGPKWHILSAVYTKSLTACRNKLQSPTSSTPFILRTEERAAKRKQKLEEKFNESEVQKVQQQRTLKEKAGNEFRKLSRSFCFKARPLPDFYKERETPKIQTKKTSAPQPKSAVLGRSTSNKKQGTTSMPRPPPPPPSYTNAGVSKNLPKKNVPNQSKLLTTSLPESFTHENASPNIQL